MLVKLAKVELRELALKRVIPEREVVEGAGDPRKVGPCP